MKNNAKRNLFVTGSGILVAILVVWAQLWVTTGQIYEEKHQSLISVGLGLTFIYAAIFFAALSFAIIFLSRVNIVSVSLFCSALIITLGEVSLSGLSVVLKTMSNVRGILSPTTGLGIIYDNRDWIIWLGICLAVLVPFLMIVYKRRKLFENWKTFLELIWSHEW
jgi:hypothetical protein